MDGMLISEGHHVLRQMISDPQPEYRSAGIVFHFCSSSGIQIPHFPVLQLCGRQPRFTNRGKGFCPTLSSMAGTPVSIVFIQLPAVISF